MYKWVKVMGIPLHLRGEETYWAVGDRCVGRGCTCYQFSWSRSRHLKLPRWRL
ncbi:hypothetical protein CsSME_00031967 [Camellia sinensis var. sinensis]